MTKTIEQIKYKWENRISVECAQQNKITQITILNWLLGEHPEQWETFTDRQLENAEKEMNYRLCILNRRYLEASPKAAYKHLMERLGNCRAIRARILAEIPMSRDRDRRIVDALEKLVQEMLQSVREASRYESRYIQQQIAWIKQCSHIPHLRTALLPTIIEEYCLQ
ncbi:hypothetical protein [Chamaesiphon polymorphus]|uniref:Uncharacterized protein n=1 Tax=Chamaesiphon polymorphus CCALA 037 TaxID=2107692 RepID=A0A2T1GLM0_9CYAN|nr:hypothetical protein [Chamaesiphon polymorphus]PSB58771.1 hypothetical protein C7B77_03510 [Chamaesiphon polymorphus CCALA 037]